jgi:hypothetical protein
MADDAASAGGTELQFDRITEPGGSPAGEQVAVPCASCSAPIRTFYFTINSATVCDRCRATIEDLAESPPGWRPLIRAGLFGFGAGVGGAAIYYAVLVIANLEIGIVAVLIGYLVGAAVRKGTSGRGGIRFQFLAVALTYASVAMAYAPIAIAGAIRSQNAATTAAATNRSATTRSARPAGQPGASSVAVRRQPPPAPPSAGALLLGLGTLAVFLLVLPVLVIIGSMPFGAITALIIFVGLRQAWRMTAAPIIDVYGPYQVGATPSGAAG